ncbi:DNA replication and repair protein RecF [Candidatus Peregrinibacteria bacterium]|nr:MAG: DNA replication and repair protein RecF [Candidatus Peregrinibacteria bacterium]
MRLKNLKITGFRNLKPVQLEWDPAVTTYAFVGPNGHGKTNLLEAIYLLGISKSFRTHENEDFIGFDETFCRLETYVENGHEVDFFELIVTKGPIKKTLKRQGIIKKAVEYIGHLKVVFFSPDDINLIQGAPANRRRYLDVLLSQLDPAYLEDSLRYAAVLKQRNALLKRLSIEKGGASPKQLHELDFWDQALAQLGSTLIAKRVDGIQALNQGILERYRVLSERSEHFCLQYLPSVPANIKENDYYELLTQNRLRDLQTGFTEKGPHRDDLEFSCQGKNMASFASRGNGVAQCLRLNLPKSI